MKLLLTSSGITNESIKKALQKLLHKPFEEANLAFVPTAANVEPGDKSWLIEDIIGLQKCGFKQVDIVDISAVSKDIWLPRLREADVIVFSGGNTYHLIHEMRRTGLVEVLKDLLKTRVYVGISAGSMVPNTNLLLTTSAKLYEETSGEVKDDSGLKYVKFHIRPHLNSPSFPNITIPYLEKKAKETNEPIYAIDNQSAVVVDGDKIEIVSEGVWKKFN
ncbi:MAG TPA: Type 1 glutamine amidotransferase-like domain-containing protein [Patescibacteria group bacterium]|nr:Type 1 glutamine amidotransferase-like domain-containing protein [Patescibacteria group bacterium]